MKILTIPTKPLLAALLVAMLSTTAVGSAYANDRDNDERQAYQQHNLVSDGAVTGFTVF